MKNVDCGILLGWRFIKIDYILMIYVCVIMWYEMMKEMI